MFDSFINSFCKVQFLCYQGEPNWLGIIVLLVPGVILFLIISLILVLLPEAIRSAIEDKLLSRQEKKERRKEKKEKRKWKKEKRKEEFAQLDRKQKVFRVISQVSQPFKFLIGVLSMLIGLVVLGFIWGFLDQLF